MRKNLIKSLALAGMIFISAISMAQSRTVTGKIADSGGSPLPGVNVVLQGTTTGTISNIDGEFAIEVTDINTNVLIFSFIGFRNQNVPLAGQTTLAVVLEDDFIGLEEVVAVGYGVVRKSDLTGSVSSVSADEIAKTTTSNAIQAIQARVPGVDIQQSSGEAGAGVSINLRGNRSLSASNDPLILVDGIEYGKTLDINPSDIASMEILKDASSTAIYGSKGANGVILITTKRGKPGKTNVTFNSFVSSNQPTHIPQVMFGQKEVQRLIDKANYQADTKTKEWGGSQLTVEEVLTESGFDFTEMDVYRDGSYTDWLDIILQDGMTQNYELSVSGGDEKTTFNLSLGALYEEGLMKNDNLDRYNTRANIDHKINDRFKVGTSILYTFRNHDARQSSVFGQALKMSSIAHPYSKDGEIIEKPNPRYAAHVNPLLDEVDGAFQKNTERTRFFGNSYLEITPFKGLLFRTVFALDRRNDRIGTYQDFKSVARAQGPGTGYMSSEWENRTKYTWENTLNYNTNFDGSIHDVTLLLGQSMNQEVYEQMISGGDAGREHYYQSAFYDLSKASSITTTNKHEKNAMLSYFSRVNYKFTEKYLFTASMRADGSSALAEGNKWGYFPSVAGAWRLSEELFLENTKSWLTNLKLRASWGVSGNSAIKPYETIGRLSVRQSFYYFGGNDVAGNLPSNIGNPNLKWETTAAFNYGLDFGFANNRITGSIDYFNSNTYDLLYYKSAPPSSIFPSVLDNVGETKSNGIEIALNTLVVNGQDFSWDINWSYSTFKDEITSLADGLEKSIMGREAHIVGQQVSIFYDYETTGIWDVGEFDAYIEEWETKNPDQKHQYISAYGVPGTIKINDINGDGKIDDDDKVVYNRAPKHIIGMNNTFTYKNISLSALIYARIGGYMQYDMNSQLNFESANWGELDYWTLNNTGAKFPNPGTASATYNNYGSALLYEKADYIKIKDLTLAYNIPSTILDNVGISSFRLYGSLKNYFTFSSVENYDSERGGSINFPLAKQVVFGVNVQF